MYSKPTISDIEILTISINDRSRMQRDERGTATFGFLLGHEMQSRQKDSKWTRLCQRLKSCLIEGTQWTTLARAFLSVKSDLTSFVEKSESQKGEEER